MEKETLTALIVINFIVTVLVAAFALWRIRKLKASVALDNSDIAADVRKKELALKGEIQTLGKNLSEEIADSKAKIVSDYAQLNKLREDDITKLREETPMYEVNDKNEAILRTRQGQQIHNYKLSKK